MALIAARAALRPDPGSISSGSSRRPTTSSRRRARAPGWRATPTGRRAAAGDAPRGGPARRVAREGILGAKPSRPSGGTGSGSSAPTVSEPAAPGFCARSGFGLPERPGVPARADPRRRPRAGRLQLMRATRANLSPIFGLVRRSGGRPGRRWNLDDGDPDMRRDKRRRHRHRFWAVTTRAAIAASRAALADSEILIADGHHRYETAVA